MAGAGHAVGRQEIHGGGTHRLGVHAGRTGEDVDGRGRLADDGVADLRAPQQLRLRIVDAQRRADAAAEVLIDGLAVFLQDERIGAVFKQRGQIFQLQSGRIPLGSCFSFWIMTSDSSSAITITPTAIR